MSRVLHDTERAPDTTSPTLVEVDPFALAAEVIDSTHPALRDLRRVAERTAQPAAKVGALKAIPQVGASLFDLLARLNLAPSVTGQWWTQREFELAVAALADVARARPGARGRSPDGHRRNEAHYG